MCVRERESVCKTERKTECERDGEREISMLFFSLSNPLLRV